MKVDLIFANSKLSLGSEQMKSAWLAKVLIKLILIHLTQKEFQLKIAFRPFQKPQTCHQHSENNKGGFSGG